MKYIVALLLLTLTVSIQAAKPKHHQLQGYNFQRYVSDFEKSHSNEEYEYRRQIFEENLEEIHRHNADTTKSWKKGVNKFTDMTQAEFKAFYLGLEKMPLEEGSSSRILEENSGPRRPHGPHGPHRPDGQRPRRLPKQVDYRDQGVLTPVKDQGHCGSCWAFAGTETIETMAAINSGELVQLSTQQITSCAPNANQCGGGGGCTGAIGEVVFFYVTLYGQTLEELYPYKAITGTCDYNFTEHTPAVRIDGFQKLPSNNQDVLLETLANFGPPDVSVDASNWHSYESGIFDGCDYSENIDINHSQQLVGYGEDQDGLFYVTRNSWGPDWGENGFIRLRRSRNTECGTDSTPSHGFKCQNDGVVTQEVCGMCGVLSHPAIVLGARTV